MRRPTVTNRKLVALALLAGAGGACSNTAEEDASDTTGQEQYAQQIQSELDAAALSDPNSFNNFKPVRPVLKCIDKLANNQYKAHFGYTNSSSTSVSIPVGFFNRFWPPPISRGQPTTFAPGSQADVVQVQFSGFSASVWVLGTHFAFATKFSKLCPVGGTGGSGVGGSGQGGSGQGGRGMGGSGQGGSGQGGSGQGGRGMGGSGQGGSGQGGSGQGGSGQGGSGQGGSGQGGSGQGGSGQGGSGQGGSGQGGACVAPTNCDDQNPCTVDSVDTTLCVCVHVAGIDGTTCNDGNACTTVDSCVAGVCVGGSPKTCTALDQCHVAGVCAPATGVCSNPAAPNGITCSDGNACTRNDICTDGVCTMGTPTLCNAPDVCHTAGTCDATTGNCTGTAAPNGTLCNDGNACTATDTCQTGVCTGSAPKTCPAIDQCHIAGVCDPANGNCSTPTAPNGSTCNDANACTTGEACQAGVCVGGTAKVCTALDSCHTVGTCDTVSGVCSNPNATNGTTCTDNNACTTGDSCVAGACVPGAPLVCPAPTNSCQIAGSCVPATGLCTSGNKPDGTSCDDGNLCSTGDACMGGVCVAPVVNPPTHCDTVNCEQCTSGVGAGQPDVCSATPESCFNCDPAVTGCELYTDPTDKALCEAVYACFVAPTHPGAANFAGFCFGTGGDPLPCWCGTNQTTCATSNAAPTQANGPCLQQIFAAAKSTDAATIQARFIDPSFPLGGAANLAICRGQFCAPECKLP